MIEYKELVGDIKAVYKTKDMKKIKIQSSCDAYQYFNKIFDEDTLELKEEMIVLFMNRNNNTLGWAKISSGGVAGTFADPKIVFQLALLANASSIILAHNHPSGNLKPSQADIALTRKMKAAGEVLEISMLDHLILTKETYRSMADELDY